MNKKKLLLLLEVLFWIILTILLVLSFFYEDVITLGIVSMVWIVLTSLYIYEVSTRG